jgi:GcrA cell cycle regulator
MANREGTVMSVDWTPERIEILTQLWNEGIATSEIGRRLDVTKNAVVGKVHRLGLPKRQSPIQRKPAKKKKAPEPEIITMDKLRPGMCAWPIGDPGMPGFHFCGDKAVEGKPYCEKHCEQAYVRSVKDDRNNAKKAS